MSISIKVNFVNQAEAFNNYKVVVFMKSLVTSGGAYAPQTAWIVIDNFQAGNNYPLSVGMNYTIAASDSFGNITPPLAAAPGQRFDLVSTVVGDQLHLSSTPAPPVAIELQNELPVGNIGALLYNNGILISQEFGFGPGQMATFVISPTIYIGLAAQAVQGGIIAENEFIGPATEISLMGAASMDIVMVDEKEVPGSTQPFVFIPQNVKMA